MRNTLVFGALLLALVHVALCDYELNLYLTFVGYGTGNSTGVSNAKAVGQQTTTLIDNTYGIQYAEKRFIGGSAVWVSQFNNNVETGNITFGISAPGQSHIIKFILLSYQNIDQWHGYQHGAGYYNVTGGIGAFAGADGLLASTKTVNTTDWSYFQHITGSLWIPGNPPPPPSF